MLALVCLPYLSHILGQSNPYYRGSAIHPAMTGTVLLTGASSGIGLSMTRILAKDGWNLIVVGRNQEALEKIREELEFPNHISVYVIVKDLSKDGAAEELYSDVKKMKLQVDFLINCAGIGDFGRFADSKLQRQIDQVHINDLSLTVLTRLFLPDMIARGSGRILNVSSIAAFQPGPLMSVYYASKAYVQSFTEALAVELKGTGVRVSVLCPGPTDTPFLVEAGQTGQNMFKKSACKTADYVAEYGLKRAMKNKVVIVVGLSSKLLIFFERLLPRSVIRRVVYMIQKKPVKKEKKKKE